MDLETQVYDDGAETPVEEIISEEIEEDVPEADDFAALSTQKYVEAEPEGAEKTSAASSLVSPPAESAPPAPAVRLATAVPKPSVSFSDDEMSDDVYDDEARMLAGPFWMRVVEGRHYTLGVIVVL